MTRENILISTQDALIGNVRKNVRAITIAWTENSFLIRFYLDDEPLDIDYEIAGLVTTEIAACLPNLKKFKEEVIYSTSPRNSLEVLDEWVFVRFENDF
jgi:hypothetical protein